MTTFCTLLYLLLSLEHRIYTSCCCSMVKYCKHAFSLPGLSFHSTIQCSNRYVT